jgi:membrane glycosyltransferase
MATASPVLSSRSAMRMRQSIADIEEAFFEEIEEDRERRERLRRHAEQRSRRRHVERTHRQGSVRFVLVLLTLIATAVIVTIAMFQTLYYVMG